jgi:HK97 family phage portal protein
MIAEFFASIAGTTQQMAQYVNASIENPRYSLNDPALYELLTGGMQSASGVTVTHENSLTIAAVNQAVNLLSGDVAKLPLYPYKRLPDDDREIFSKHPAYHAVAIKANPYKSAKRFWRDIMVHRLLWANGYGYISRTPKGFELYNLLPDRTAPEWHDGRMIYVTEVAGKLKALDPSQVIHIRGISVDGNVGLDLTKCARDAWGLSLAAQNFESKFFKNGARMGGVLELPIGLSKPAKDTVEEGFRKSYEEGDNPFKTVILREGAKFHAGQVTPQQGQVSELRAERRRDIAAFFNLPPSKLGIPGSVSYNSYEQESLAYLHGCLHHLLDDNADECDQKLLTEDERRNDSAYFEHNVSKFTQADWGTQVEKLVELRNAEIVNPNEVRKKLNMPKRTDPGGDKYENPNTRPAPGTSPASEPPKKTKQATDAHRRLFVDALGRMARRVSFDARKDSGDSKKFTTWIDSEAAKHKGVFWDSVRPVAAAYTSVFGGDDAEITAKAESVFFTEVMGLSSFLDAPHAACDLQTNVSTYLDTFERTGPEKVAAAILENANV